MATNRVLDICGSIIALAVIAALIFRTHFGVDLTDESLYVAYIVHFVRGARPFIDELSSSQTAALFLIPIFKFLMSFGGGIDGIVLTTRTLHVASAAITTLVVFKTLQNVSDRTSKLLISLLCLTFVPFNIQSLSYNTLGFEGLTIGLFSLFASVTVHWSYAILGGASLALSVISYPTYAMPAFVAFLILSIHSGLEKRILISVVLAGILVSICVFPYFWRAGAEALLQIPKYMSTYGIYNNGLEKFTDIWRSLLIAHGAFIPISMLLTVWIAHRDFSSSQKALALSALLCLSLLSPVPIYTASLFGIIQIALLGLPLYLGCKKNSAVKDLILLVWFPSFIAGNMSGWSSGNGTMSVALGFFPAALVSLVIFSHITTNRLEKNSFDTLTRQGTLTVINLAFLLFLFIGESFYTDGKFYQLTSLIDSGPFAGLYTNETRKHFIQSLTEDVSKFTPASHKVLYMDLFSAGFLLTPLPSLTGSLWVSNIPKIRKKYADAFNHNLKEGDVVVQIKRDFSAGVAGGIMGGELVETKDILITHVKKKCVLMLDSKYYSIYQAQGTFPTFELK